MDLRIIQGDSTGERIEICPGDELPDKRFIISVSDVPFLAIESFISGAILGNLEFDHYGINILVKSDFDKISENLACEIALVERRIDRGICTVIDFCHLPWISPHKELAEFFSRNNLDEIEKFLEFMQNFISIVSKWPSLKNVFIIGV